MFRERIKVSTKQVSANSADKFSKASDNIILSKEDREFYKENGYIVIRGLIDHDSLSKYKQHFADICNGKRESVTVIKEVALVGKDKKLEEYVNKIQDILHDEVFMTYSENPKILDIVSQFIGNEITAVNLMMINKPPGSLRHPPHQDAKKLFHCVVDENKHAPLEKRLNLEMDPGDTIFFHPYLLHGSGTNLTQEYRKALTIHYASANCYYIDVTGTVQQDLDDEYKGILKKRGLENMNYVDFVKIKCKLIRGLHSNL